MRHFDALMSACALSAVLAVASPWTYGTDGALTSALASADILDPIALVGGPW